MPQNQLSKLPETGELSLGQGYGISRSPTSFTSRDLFGGTIESGKIYETQSGPSKSGKFVIFSGNQYIPVMGTREQIESASGQKLQGIQENVLGDIVSTANREGRIGRGATINYTDLPNYFGRTPQAAPIDPTSQINVPFEQKQAAMAQFKQQQVQAAAGAPASQGVPLLGQIQAAGIERQPDLSLGRKLGPREFKGLVTENRVTEANFNQFFNRDKFGNIYLKTNAPGPQAPLLAPQQSAGVRPLQQPLLTPQVLQQPVGITTSVAPTVSADANLPTTTSYPTTAPTELSDISNQLYALGKLSPEETTAQTQLNKLIQSKDLGLRNIEEQPIALPFITGQSAALERRAETLTRPLIAQLALLQQQKQTQRQAALDVVGLEKYKIDREQLQVQREQIKATQAQHREQQTRIAQQATQKQTTDQAKLLEREKPKVEKLSADERKGQEMVRIENLLNKARETNLKFNKINNVEADDYRRIKSDAKISPAEFDNRYGHNLSRSDQATLGVEPISKKTLTSDQLGAINDAKAYVDNLKAEYKYSEIKDERDRIIKQELNATGFDLSPYF